MASKTNRSFSVFPFLVPLLISTGLSLPDVAGSETADSFTRVIPFELVRGHLILVKASIGGIESLNAIVDTGASESAISCKLAKKLGLQTKSSTFVSYGRKHESREVVIPEVGLGELVFEKVPAVVMNLSFFHGVRVDALLGLNLLKRTSLLIDYEAQTLTFGASGHFPTQMAFSPRAPIVLMRVAVGQVELALILDTGCPDVILYEGRVQGRLDYVGTRSTMTLRNTGGKLAFRKAQLRHVRMKEMEWENVEVKILQVPAETYGTLDGVLGPLSLGIKRIQVDFKEGVVSWSP